MAAFPAGFLQFPEEVKMLAADSHRPGRRGRCWAGRLAICCAAVCLQVASPAVAEDDQTPPQLFYLEVDGKKVPIDLDKPFQTSSLAGAKTVTLRTEAYRVFPYGGLRFHYPRDYAFQANLESKAVSIWTLSGSDCMLMVQRYNGAADHEGVLDAVKTQLLENYKTASPKVTSVKLNVQGTDWKGTRIEARVVTALIHQDLYVFKSGKDTVLLVLQDAPQDDGKASAERGRMEKLLAESIKLPQK